jgi:hypothetical protein
MTKWKPKTRTIRLTYAVWRRLDKTARSWNLTTGQYVDNDIRRILGMKLLKVKRRQRS